MKMPKSLIAITFSALLPACVVGPDYQRPETGSNARFSNIISESEGLLMKTETLDIEWWNTFADPKLAELIDLAILNNTDVRAATARLDEARALRRIAVSNNKPVVESQSSASRTQQSQEVNLPLGAPAKTSLFDLGLTAAWELDLFGRLRRSTEAAEAQFVATLEDRRQVLQIVLAEVALNYADLRTAQRQLAVAEKNVEIARETLWLTELLASQELVRQLDVIRSRADITELVAAQSDFISSERRAAARLAVLVGEQPASLMSNLMAPAKHTLQAPRIPVGLTSALLRRRGDVRAAERRLAAASANIGVEIANRFPRFQLTGGLASTAIHIDDLFTRPSEAWNIAGILSWPLMDGNRREAAVDAARARFDGAFAAYDAAVLNALGDAETAFASYVYATKERQTLQSARQDREQALKLTRLRYEEELDDLFPVLDSQRQLLALETKIASSTRAELVAAINVYRALGGGWDSAEKRLEDKSLTN